MSSLRSKQSKFVLMVGKLIVYSYDQRLELTFGETVRSIAEAGTMSKSLHIIRLAIDLNLFIGGVYQIETKAYLPLGEYWESLGGSWGGRFLKPDGNHFSLAHEGVR